MPRLAQHFHVVALDLPGHGDSDKPQDGYDTETVARRVHGLLDRIGLKTYALAAHDIGAWVAPPYALMFPAGVGKLALLDAGIPGVTLPDMLPAAPHRAWRTWHFAFNTVPDLPEELIAGRERVYLYWFRGAKPPIPSASARPIATSTCASSASRARCALASPSTAPSLAPQIRTAP